MALTSNASIVATMHTASKLAVAATTGGGGGGGSGRSWAHTTTMPGDHHQVAEYLVSALEACKDGMTLETKSLHEYWTDDNGPC